MAPGVLGRLGGSEDMVNEYGTEEEVEKIRIWLVKELDLLSVIKG
jgi:hypothetical protein